MSQAFVVGTAIGVHVVVAEGKPPIPIKFMETPVVELPDEFREREWEERSRDRQSELPLVLVDHSVANSLWRRASTKTDNITRSGLQADTGDLDLAHQIMRQIFTAHELG